MNWQDRLLIVVVIVASCWLVSYLGQCSLMNTCLRPSYDGKNQRTAQDCGFKP